jgi:uncharacterized protein (TIGR03067 family)
MNARRMSREKQSPVPLTNAAAKLDASQDVQLFLDQELSRLPEKYRTVIVLCDLEGRTRKEAAAQLGIPEGTVAGRQTRGRAMLARRLARHGFTLSGGALAAALTELAASASAPTSAVAVTIKTASVLVAGGVIAPNVAILTQGVVNAMFLSKLKSICGILIMILGLGLSTAALSSAFAHGDAKERDAVAGASDGQPAKDMNDAEAPRVAAPAPKTDEEKLQGVWKVVKRETGGKVVTEREVSPIHKTVFDGNRVESQPKQFWNGTYTLDRSKNPKQITIIGDFPVAGTQYKGIYALDGDDLRLCISFFIIDRRQVHQATEFKTKESSSVELFTVKRDEVTKGIEPGSEVGAGKAGGAPGGAPGSKPGGKPGSGGTLILSLPGTDVARWLMYPSVHNELKLTEDQVIKLRQGVDDGQKRWNKVEAGFKVGLGQKVDPQSRSEISQKVVSEFRKTLEDVLDAGQLKRLRQIEIQQQGIRALQNKEVVAALKLTEEQKGPIKTFNEELDSKLQDWMKTLGRDGPNEAVAAQQKMLREAADRIPALLTPEQRRRWEALTGKPFRPENLHMIP